MNGGGRPAATRSNLLRARGRLGRVRRGTDLLVRKRRALVSELLELAAPAADARGRVAERAGSAYGALLRSLAVRGGDELRALGWPSREVEVEVREVEVWGIAAGEIVGRSPVRRSVAARGTAAAGTGPAAALAADEFEALVELLLDAASREMLMRRLGRALARTSRQVNTLERRVAPELEARIRSMSRTLDEREREERTRLKRLLRSRGGAARPRGGS